MITTQADYMRRLANIQNQNEISVQTINTNEEPHFIIDADSRTIAIPSAFKFLGIKGDHNAETIYFEIDRYFDDHDLSEETCVVQYKITTSNGLDSSEGIYHVTEIDTTSIPGKIIFGWTIKNAVTSVAAKVSFSVRFYSVENSDTNSVFKYNFNTLEASLPILDTLSTTDFPFDYTPTDAQTLITTFDDAVKKTQQNVKTAELYAGNAAVAAKNAAEDAVKEFKSQLGDNLSSLVNTYLTPEQFGAVGDGVTDDAAALQAAIDAASTHKKTLELKHGATYKHKSDISLKDDLTIIGNGAVLLSDIQCGISSTDRQAVGGWGRSDTDLVQNIRLENITFRAADTCETNYMLRFARARHIVVRDCLFDCDINEMSRSCLDLYGVNEDIRFEHCIFRQLTAGKEGGIWVRSWKDNIPSKNIRFLNCDFYKAGGDEVFAAWGWCGVVTDVLISGCNFYQLDDEKYRSRGYYPAWFITLGQSGKECSIRMENCVVKVNRCNSVFRMPGVGTRAIVDNCDIYSDQPEDMPKFDLTQGANPMLAMGNGNPYGSIFTNNRVHLRGDSGRRICYMVGSLRNNRFDMEIGNGPASCNEVIGNIFKGKFTRQIFNDCGTFKDNVIEAEVPTLSLFAGASIVEENQYTLTVTETNQGSSIFYNNWGSGSIRNNKIEINCATDEPYTIKKYNFPMKNSVPEYIDGNIVIITGDVEYDSPHLPSVLRGTVYRKNNFFNNVKERLFECTGVTFAENSITEQYKKNTSLAVTIEPEGCTDPVIYTWNDPDGVLEAEDEKYRPLKNGTASVTVICGMYEATQTIKVELVPVACESIRLSRIKALCGVGQTTYLKAFVTPYWSTDEVIWSSDAEDVAAVTQDGTVTLLKTGSANITVTCGTQTAACALTVVEADQLPTYTDGALELDNIVAYVPLPNLAKEHTLYLSLELDSSSVDPGEELPLISNLLSGQTGQEAVRVAFGADSSGYRTLRWTTTDVEADEDGNTACYKVPYANNGFKATGTASSAFLYLKSGVANPNGAIVWGAETSTVKPASDSGYLSFNVQTSDGDQPVSNYATGAALQAALTSGAVHATKAKGFKIHELILFANSSYDNINDIKMYREGAEIDLRFDANGEPVNAGTAGGFVIAGKGSDSEASDTSSILGSAILGKAILNNGGNV